MNKQSPRIRIVVGHYGSGKTELSINMALGFRQENLPAMLVDLDIVNPFFRSAEQSQLLAREAVELICPNYAQTGVDVPSLPADIYSLFARKELSVVIDVGGDDTGARALGMFKPYFDQNGYEMLYVINIFRPFSDTEEAILSMMNRIESTSRLKVSGLINNSNLGHLTQAAHLQAGHALIEKVSKTSGVPIVGMSGLPEVLSQTTGIPVRKIPLRRLTLPEWMVYV